MDDKTGDQSIHDEVALDWPGTLTPEDDWEGTWPKSHKVWNVMVPFQAVGHSKEQAPARYDQFAGTLGQLQLDSDGEHPLDGVRVSSSSFVGFNRIQSRGDQQRVSHGFDGQWRPCVLLGLLES